MNAILNSSSVKSPLSIPFHDNIHQSEFVNDIPIQHSTNDLKSILVQLQAKKQKQLAKLE